MATVFDDEMRRALEQDGEKLRQMTGTDHGPYFIIFDEASDYPEGIWDVPLYDETDVMVAPVGIRGVHP